MKISLVLVILVTMTIILNTEGKRSCVEVLKEIKTSLDGYENNNPGSLTCKKGWIKRKQSCYFFSTDKRSWRESESDCNQHGSHLVKVDDQKENQWLYSKSPKGQHIFWLGASDIKNEGQWIWTSDLSGMCYQTWDKNYNEPNGGTRENCLNLIGSDHVGRGQWNDNNCSVKLYYVCEKTIN